MLVVVTTGLTADRLGVMGHLRTISGLGVPVIFLRSPLTGGTPDIRKEERELSKSTGMRPRLILPMGFGELDHEIEIALYRSVQEALHNVAKHSRAKNFVIRFEIDNGSAVLRVEDDGVGFSGKGTSRSRSFGLLGMRERIAALGGTVRIRSRKGTGTRITVMLPLPASSARHASRTDLLAGAGGFSSKYEGALEAQTNLSPANTHNVHQVHSS